MGELAEVLTVMLRLSEMQRLFGPAYPLRGRPFNLTAGLVMEQFEDYTRNRDHRHHRLKRTRIIC